MSALLVRSSLPDLPAIAVEVVGERDASRGGRYLSMRIPELRLRYPDGTPSAAFTYDLADRRQLDAVVVVPHFRDALGVRHVVLRSAFRPPVALRRPEARPVPEKPTLGGLWEVVAGLVEESEQSAAGLVRCAVRELWEEVGARVSEAEMKPLGPSTFPCPGVIGERHFFFHAEIDAASVVAPPEDGSVLEARAAVVAVPLAAALAATREGLVEDAKSELALRRLAELG